VGNSPQSFSRITPSILTPPKLRPRNLHFESTYHAPWSEGSPAYARPVRLLQSASSSVTAGWVRKGSMPVSLAVAFWASTPPFNPLGPALPSIATLNSLELASLLFRR